MVKTKKDAPGNRRMSDEGDVDQNHQILNPFFLKSGSGA